ncbi:hypothetical protein [Mycobacterium nebraskense]|nr:hypothetical protein [Mycobacterium nebraskense]
MASRMHPNAEGPTLFHGASLAAILVLTVTYVSLFLIHQQHVPAWVIFALGVRVAALPAVWFTSRRLRVSGPGLRLLGYAASLILVFGDDMVVGIHDWIWMPPCRKGGGVGADAADLLFRVLEALLGLAVAARFSAAAQPPRRAGVLRLTSR